MARFMVWLGLAAVLLIATQPASRGETTVSCPVTPGFIRGPFVPTEDMAREIFKIMASEFASFNLNEYPVIVIEDKGDYWWASQEALQPTSGFGGGQLYMRIDKCTGAISHAAYNK